MQFGQRVRDLRQQRNLHQRELEERIGVSVSYISKVENENLHFGDYLTEKFIHKQTAELDADEEELLLLADKIPEGIRRRIRERPDIFRKGAALNDRTLDVLLREINDE